jgi:hypothetical protein
VDRLTMLLIGSAIVAVQFIAYMMLGGETSDIPPCRDVHERTSCSRL